MAAKEVLASPSIKDLINANSIYFLAYSWLFGQSVWQSFFAGVIAHKALSRQMFTVLQARTFPYYFATSSLLSSLLLTLWARANQEEILNNYKRVGNTTVQQAAVLLIVAVLSLVNWFYIGPTTNKIIVTRQRLERAEGKPYNDAGVSKQMKDVNWSFTIWHSVSALANLVMILALLYHGAWFANFGLLNSKKPLLPL